MKLTTTNAAPSSRAVAHQLAAKTIRPTAAFIDLRPEKVVQQKMQQVIQATRRKPTRRKATKKVEYTDYTGSDESFEESNDDFSFGEYEDDYLDGVKESERFEMLRTPGKRQKFFPYGFYSDTRENLMRAQNFHEHSESSDDEASMDDTMGGRFTLKKFKKNWIENREFVGKKHQPIIDHKLDVEAYIQGYDEAFIYEGDPPSPTTEDSFKQYVYNDEENLRILPKRIDKDSSINPTYRTDTIPQSMVTKAKKRWKELWPEYQDLQEEKGSKQERLYARRKKQNRKRRTTAPKDTRKNRKKAKISKEATDD